MKLKGIIFDVDGTLVNTVPLNVECFKEVFLSIAEKSLTESQIKDLFGPNERGTMAPVLGDRVPEGFDLFLKLYEERHKKYPLPYPGIRELLTDLERRGVKLAIVTGKGAESTHISLDLLELDQFFEFKETGAFEGPVKPVGIRKVLKAWGLSPEEVGYVGDSPLDMEDAATTGLVGFAVAWDKESALLHGHPDAFKTCSSPQDILSFV